MTAAPADALGLAWSGGKDSAMAMYALQQEAGRKPNALLTTYSRESQRVSIHGVRRELVQAQARAAGASLVESAIPADCTPEQYDRQTLRSFSPGPLAACATIAFGDLFLADVRRNRERLVARAGKTACFPLWGRDTRALAAAFIDAGFRAFVVCVDTQALDASFAGRPYDHDFVGDLPRTVDPCGENGEFHTFVWSGPIFDGSIPCEVGQTVGRGGFMFTDLRPPPLEEPNRPDV
jgi:uncharacterized protein (TIGR00290 family)